MHSFNTTETPAEPTLVVPDSLKSVLQELQRLEPIFHAAYRGATPQQFEAVVAPEFWEIGASGRNYSRAFALSVLRDRQQTPSEAAWQTSDFHVSEVAPDTYLLTYTLVQPGQHVPRTTRRMTLWQRRDGAYKAVFHQGTVVVGNAA
jgi:hypothetical protein